MFLFLFLFLFFKINNNIFLVKFANLHIFKSELNYFVFNVQFPRRPRPHYPCQFNLINLSDPTFLCMYMRPGPNNLVPAPGIPGSSGQPGIQPAQVGINPTVRFYELLDALKMEYEIILQSGSMHHDSSNKLTINEYEAKGTLNFITFYFIQFQYFGLFLF